MYVFTYACVCTRACVCFMHICVCEFKMYAHHNVCLRAPTSLDLLRSVKQIVRASGSPEPHTVALPISSCKATHRTCSHNAWGKYIFNSFVC